MHLSSVWEQRAYCAGLRTELKIIGSGGDDAVVGGANDLAESLTFGVVPVASTGALDRIEPEWTG